MSNLKKKKYIALLSIVVIVIGIIGLFVFGRIDKYKGLIRVKNVVSDTTVLSASISNAVEQPNTSKGSDEIKYEISYTLDRVDGVETRDVIIKGKLTEPESKYARFKKITGNNITSTLSNEGKEIEVEVKDVPLGIENKTTLKLVITNAPNEYKVKPEIKIKEKTSEEETTVITNTVEVQTSMISGIVKDEKGMPVSNIELSLNNGQGEIKRTYTDEEGKYIFSDIENGNYTIEVEEEIYEVVGNNKITDSGNLNLIVKEVSPYELEAHKYITNLDLVINGKEEHYTYNDLEKVVQSVKNAKTISGQITYKITLKNVGEKTGKLSMLKDIVEEGLSFDSKKNAGWKEKEDNIYYEPINNVSMAKGETREIGLVLDIKETNEIKTYINEIDVNGETYERVVYILNGEKYREENVILGEKIEEVQIDDDSFDGWYTDKNYTNKYNYKNEVTKDLILYGRTEIIKHKVEFYDKDPETEVETKWDEQEIKEGDKATEPAEPQHEGYTFECWMDEHDNIWNFNNPLERDVKLVSCYSINQYTITYNGLTNEEKENLDNPPTYTIKDTVVIKNADDRYDEDNLLSGRFIGWTGSNGTTPSTNVTFSHETGNKEYTANFERVEPDEYLITYVLDGGRLKEGKSNPNSYTKKTSTFTLNNPSKPHYTFIGWTGSNGNTPQTTVTMEKGQNEGDKEFIANYQIITHDVTFKDIDPENPVEETAQNFGDPVKVNDGDKVTPPGTNPEHTGYTCDKWSTKLNGNYEEDAYDFNSEVTNNLTLYPLCKKNSYTVTYMDGETQYAIETVLYKEKTTKPSTDPDHKNEHKMFLGWTLNNATYDFNTLVTEDITLYANYEIVEAPVISHTPTEWTNQDVNVTITNAGTAGKDYTGYTYKYRIEDGNLVDYLGSFEIGENCDVYAIAYKNGVSSEEVKHEITNIDKIKPIINNLNNFSTDFTSFIVNLKSKDNESGLVELNYYVDDSLVGSVTYNEDLNKERNEIYQVNDLESGRTYTFKVVAVDAAGNESQEELSVTTQEEEKIVARIIGTNNSLFDDESLYVNLPSLKAGLEYNENGLDCTTNQCTIQMLESVTESNNVLDGQNITLDLNGKTITGVVDYTIDNSGSFTILDNSEGQGTIINTTNIAIKNESTGILTLGENDTERNVSLTTPNVVGSNIGIQNLGRFNFYDGRIEGIIAIDGQVDDTPYLYNANVKVEDTQVAGLYMLSDAEARIKNVYYTKVQKAVDDSKIGTVETKTENHTYIDELKRVTNYQFVKENDTYVSKNTDNNTATTAYFYYDMRSEMVPKLFSTEISVSSNEDDYAYVTYSESKTVPSFYKKNSNNILAISGEQSNVVGTKILEPGKEYYIYFSYNKDYNTTPAGEDKMTIHNIKVGDIDYSSIMNSIELHDIPSYGFKITEDNVIVSNNDTNDGNISYSEVQIDMTNYTEDKFLCFSHTVELIEGTYTSGYVNIDGTNYTANSTSVSNPRVLLKKGTVHTLKFVSNPNGYNSISKYKIWNMRLVDISDEVNNLSNFTQDAENSNFNFEYNSSNNTVKTGTNNTNTYSSYMYYTFDMTSETEDKTLYLDVSYKLYRNYYAQIYLTNDTGITATDGYILNASGNTSSNNRSLFVTLKAGEINYLHFRYTGNSNSSFYFTLNKMLYLADTSTMVDFSNRNLIGHIYQKFEKAEPGEFVPVLYPETEKVLYPTQYRSYFDITTPNETSNKYLYVTSYGSSPYSVKKLSDNTNIPCKYGYIASTDNGYLYNYFYEIEPNTDYRVTLGGTVSTSYIDVGYTSEFDYDNASTNYDKEVEVPILNQEVDKVELLKNVSLENPLEIVKERDVILDLKGYDLIYNSTDYAIKNNGSLRITNSVAENAIQTENAIANQELIEVNNLKDRYLHTKATINDYYQENLFSHVDAYTGYTDLKGNVPDIAFSGPAYNDMGLMESYSGSGDVSGLVMGVGPMISLGNNSFTTSTTFSLRELNSSSVFEIYFNNNGENIGSFLIYNSYGRIYVGGAGIPSKDIYDYFKIGELYNFVVTYDCVTHEFVVYANGEKIYNEVSTSLIADDTTKVKVVTNKNNSSSQPVNVYNTKFYTSIIDRVNMVNNYYVDINRFANNHYVPEGNAFDDDPETYIVGGTSIFFPSAQKHKKITISFEEGYYPDSLTLVGSVGRTNYSPIETKTQQDIVDNKMEFVLSAPVYYQSYALSINSSVETRITEIDFDYIDQDYKDVNLNVNLQDFGYNSVKGQNSVIYNAKDAYLTLDNVEVTTTGTTSTYSLIDNYGTANIGENAYLYNTSTIGVKNENSGTVTFDKSLIYAYYGIENYSEEQSVFENAKIIGYNYSFNQKVPFDVVLNNFNMTNRGYNGYTSSSNGDKLTINNSIINTNESQFVSNTSSITINNSDIYGSLGSSSYIDINDSTIVSYGYSSYSNVSGPFNVKDSTIRYDRSKTSLYDIDIQVSSTGKSSIINSILDGVKVQYRSSSSTNKQEMLIKDSKIKCYNSRYDTCKSYFTYDSTTNFEGTNELTKLYISGGAIVNIKDELKLSSSIETSTSKYEYCDNCGMYINNANIIFNAPNSNIKGYGDIDISGKTKLITYSSQSSPAFQFVSTSSPTNIKITGDFDMSDKYPIGIYVNNSRDSYNTNYSYSVTLGEKDDKVINNPIIRGTTNALNLNPAVTFNYYDGTLIGSKNSALVGTVSDTVEDYELKHEEYDEENKEVITLSNDLDKDIAQIGDVKYKSLKEALDAVPTDGTLTQITILNSFSTIALLTIPEEKNVEIDINGNKIVSNSTNLFVNNGKLKIKDTANDPEEQEFSIINNNELSLDNVKFTNNSENNITMNSGKLTTKDSTLKNVSTDETDIIFDITSTSIDNATLLGSGVINDSNISSLTTPSVSKEVNINESVINSYNNSAITTSTDTEYKRITNAGTLNLYGGKVSGTCSNTATNPNCSQIENSGILKVFDNARITSNNIGIANYNIANIYDATIEANIGIKNVFNRFGNTTNPIITLGTKGDLNESEEVNVSITTPKIIAETIGIDVNTKVFNFYDGIIKAKEKTISGTILDKEDLYDVYISTDGDYTVNYLAKLPAARIESTGQEYYSLQEAIDAVNVENDTITILKDLLVTKEPYVVSADKKLTIDINGNTITDIYTTLFDNSGDLKIIDSSKKIVDNKVTDSGSGKIVISTDKIYFDDSYCNFNNNNNLELYGVNIEYNVVNDLSQFGKRSDKLYVFNNFGNLKLSFVDADSSDSNKLVFNGIRNNANASLDINYSNLTNYNMVLYSEGISTIDNSMIKAANVVINNQNELQINNSKVQTYKDVFITSFRRVLISNKSTATLEVNDCNFMTYGIYFTNSNYSFGHGVEGGIVTVNGGKYNSDYDSSGDLFNTSSLTINGGTFNSYVTPTLSADNLIITDIDITGGRITAKNSLNISGGTYTNTSIVNKGTGIVTDGKFNSTYTNIFENNENASLTIGIKDGESDVTSPKISTTRGTGVINNGTFSFYDGSIGGKTAIDGPVYDIEDDYSIYASYSSSLETKYLLQESSLSMTVKNDRTNEKYYKIDDAINEAGNGDTISYLRNTTYTTLTPSTIIDNDKNIKINLGSYKVDADNKLFVNNGDLIIEGNGLLKFYKNLGIENNNTMKLNTTNISSDKTSTSGNINSANIQAWPSHINNYGISILNNSSLVTTNSNVTVIQNEGTMTSTNDNIDRIINNLNLTISGLTVVDIINTGTLNVSDDEATINYLNNSGDVNATKIISTLIENSGNLKNLAIDGNINNSGNLDIHSSNVFIDTVNNSNNYTGTIKITNSSFKKMGHYNTTIKGISVTLENCTNFAELGGSIIVSNHVGGIKVSGTSEINNHSGTITSLGTTTINNNISGEINVGSGTLTYNSGTASKISVSYNSNVTILSGTIGSISNSGTLTLGSDDQEVSITDPEIGSDSKDVAIESTGTFNFYDGIVKAKETTISGDITSIPVDYLVKHNIMENSKESYLIKNDEAEARVAVVNNVNYPTLQAAVNACNTDSTCNVVIYTDIVLDEPLTVSEGKDIKVYQNGFTVTPENYITNHEGTGSIELVSGTPSGVGGAIYRFLANITGTEINPKDIVIYQMDNGEELSPAATYKLYKLIDGEYKVVRVKENEIGDYSLGAEKEILRTTTGQINIKGIGEGNYKLVGSDSKELEFDINENSVSSNIRVDRYSSKAKQTVHVVATLILTLQTGVIRQPFVVVISILLLTTIGFITYKKYRKEDLN